MTMLVENAARLRPAPTLRRRVPDVLSPRVLADLVIVTYATVVAALGALIHWLYVGWYLERGIMAGSDLMIACPVGALFLVFCLSVNALDFDQLQRFDRSIGRILAAFAGALVVFVLIAFLTKTSASISRGMILIWLASGTATLAATHWLVSRYLGTSAWLRSLATRHVAVVCGDPASSRRFVDLISAQDNRDLHLVGLFHAQPQPVPGSEGGLAAGSVDDLVNVAATRRLDEIFIAIPWHREQAISAIVERLNHLPVEIKLCPDGAAYRHPMEFAERVAGVPVATLRRQPIRDWGRLAKSSLDVSLSLVLLVALAPLMALVAVAIRLDSPGPILFRQQRHGFNHDVFDLYKFRTMRHQPGAPVIVTQLGVPGDPRVTTVGRWLRRTSLDELPQLLNVLRGEMSLVGPRPQPTVVNATFETKIRQYAGRHRVKPGITGWAQVNGWRGTMDTEEKVAERIAHDLYYIDHWSITLDLRILALTMLTGLAHKNAH